MAEDSGEKTEAPSAKRLKDAKEKGDVLKSREFATALVALVFTVVLTRRAVPAPDAGPLR